MNYTRDFDNLLAWSLQTGVLIAIAGLGAALFRLSAPRAKLLYWQLALVACMALPFLRTWKQDTIVITNSFAAPVTMAGTSLSAPTRFPSFETLVIWLLALGVVARLGWLAAGFVRMTGYRRRSEPLPPQPQWGVEAELRVSQDVASPVTFGFVKPVILLPQDFPNMDQPHREAILCHEFLHVQRHDWLFTVGEELIRAGLWFHPAIWWVLGEIQLAREQAVDEEAIGITRSRDKYIDALLAIAGAIPQPDLAAASPFLRRRHLRQRVVSILKEARMSRTKAVCSFAASLVVLVASCWLITGAIPLRGAPQVVSDAPGVAVDTNGAPLLHRSTVTYPPEALAKRIEGTVALLVKLDDKGEVVDANVVGGPDELRKTALQSVLNWHFAKEMANSTRQVAILFRLPAESTAQATPGTTVPRTLAVIRELPVSLPQTGILQTINIGGLSDQRAAELGTLLPVHVGDPFTPDVLTRVIAAANDYDEHLRVMAQRISPTEFELRISTPEVPSIPLAPAALPPPPSTPGVARVTVGAAVQASKLVTQPKPVYPPLAKGARVQGTVSFQALIGTDGTVRNLQMLSGPPLLVHAAMQAVQQWVYAPTLADGKAVEVSTPIDVNFTLAE